MGSAVIRTRGSWERRKDACPCYRKFGSIRGYRGRTALYRSRAGWHRSHSWQVDTARDEHCRSSCCFRGCERGRCDHSHCLSPPSARGNTFQASLCRYQYYGNAQSVRSCYTKQHPTLCLFKHHLPLWRGDGTDRGSCLGDGGACAAISTILPRLLPRNCVETLPSTQVCPHFACASGAFSPILLDCRHSTASTGAWMCAMPPPRTF